MMRPMILQQRHGNMQQLLQQRYLRELYQRQHGVGGGGGGNGDHHHNNQQQQLEQQLLQMPLEKCPRCDSMDTKFCYFNNYSLSQPRYFCKTCRRSWTQGGTLRDIPVGGGCRKSKDNNSSSDTTTPPSSATQQHIMTSLIKPELLQSNVAYNINSPTDFNDMISNTSPGQITLNHSNTSPSMICGPLSHPSSTDNLSLINNASPGGMINSALRGGGGGKDSAANNNNMLLSYFPSAGSLSTLGGNQSVNSANSLAARGVNFNFNNHNHNQQPPPLTTFGSEADLHLSSLPNTGFFQGNNLENSFLASAFPQQHPLRYQHSKLNQMDSNPVDNRDNQWNMIMNPTYPSDHDDRIGFPSNIPPGGHPFLHQYQNQQNLVQQNFLNGNAKNSINDPIDGALFGNLPLPLPLPLPMPMAMTMNTTSPSSTSDNSNNDNNNNNNFALGALPTSYHYPWGNRSTSGFLAPQ